VGDGGVSADGPRLGRRERARGGDARGVAGGGSDATRPRFAPGSVTGEANAHV
jgi:hypothetical protein